MSIQVEFFGLCCLIQRQDCCEVYLLDGKHLPTPDCGLATAPHVPTMLGTSDSFDPGPTWPPVLGNHAGTEFAVWSVPAGAVVDLDLKGPAPAWQNSTTLQLGDLHPGVPTHDRTTLNSTLMYPVMILRGGQLRDGAERRSVKVKGNPQTVPRSVIWTSTSSGPVEVVLNGSKRFTLHDKAVLTVTNVSVGAKPMGFEHFGFCYTTLDKVIDCKQRPDIEEITTGMKMVGSDVYDCVPPTGGS